MPKGSSVEDLAFPKGRAAIRGPESEQEPPSDAELMAASQREVGRIQALDLAESVARGTATKAAEKALERDRQRREAEADTKEGKLRQFRYYLRSLEELASKDAGAVSNAEETRLNLKLYRMENNGGPRESEVYQMAIELAGNDALAMVDPDLDGRAQAWAEKKGVFGRYRWRLQGWAAGEFTLDTTYLVATEPPPGYEPPKQPEEPREPLPPPDPMADMMKALGVAKQFKDALGLDGGGRADAAAITMAEKAAAATARMDAADRHRDELRKMEKDHREDLEAADAKGYARGLTDGRRAAEDEFRPRLWELERKLESGKEPSILEEAVKMVGGPEVVASIAKMAVASMTAAKHQPPPAPHQGAVSQSVSQSAPQALPPLQEPTKAEWRTAMDETETAVALIEESGDTSPDTIKTFSALKQFIQAGEADGPLGNWWLAWQQGYKEAVTQVLTALDTPNDESLEPTMDMEGLKTLLHRRLDEGADDAAILDELARVVQPDTRARWKKLLAWVPNTSAAAMIADGRPDHEARIEALLPAFLKS